MSDPQMSGAKTSDLGARKLLAEAIAHHQGGRAGEARRLYEQVLALDPNQPQALHLLGALTAQGQDYEQALQLMTRAATLAPNVPGFHYNLGLVLARLGRWSQAAGAFQRAIDLHPANAEALLALGDALFKSGQPEEAIAAYEKSIAIAPNHAQAHQNLAAALRDAGRLDDAVASCRRALAIEPGSAEILSDLSVLLSNGGKLDQAIAAAEAALKIEPNYWPVLNNLVVVYLTGGRVEEALVTARRAMKIEQNSPMLHWNLACALLKSGQLIEGFAEHEHRWVATGAAPRELKQPRWDGGELGGRKILIYADQGIGDTIFFARYVPLVVGRGGRIVLECQGSLERLLRQMPGVEAIVAGGSELPPFDCHCAVGSLPMVFQTMMQTIPADVPYIRANADLGGEWKRRLGGEGGGGGGRLKVGLCWAGNPRNTNNRFRSISAADLEPVAALARGKEISLFSLQKGPAAANAADGMSGDFPLIDFTAELKDFADTAALIDNLDLVISVDTAVAHLAGAMGKRTWVPLSTAADWRYFKDRDDSPWYPTMRLFRQKTLGDWTGPVGAIVSELAKLAQRPE